MKARVLLFLFKGLKGSKRTGSRPCFRKNIHSEISRKFLVAILQYLDIKCKNDEVFTGCVMEMKYKGRITVFFLVLMTNCIYITYYFIRDGFIDTIEFIGLPIMLLLAWWSGKQYDKVKLFEEKDEHQRRNCKEVTSCFKLYMIKHL